MGEDKSEKGFTVVDRRIKDEEPEEAAEAQPAGTPVEAPGPEPPEQPKASSPEEPAAADRARKPDSGRPPLPPVSFPTFLLSLHTAALIQLGVLPNPLNKEQAIDLELARQNIDLLEILEQKTKGNLTAEEGQLMTNILYELRMTYLQVCKEQNKGECK